MRAQFVTIFICILAISATGPNAWAEEAALTPTVAAQPCNQDNSLSATDSGTSPTDCKDTNNLSTDGLAHATIATTPSSVQPQATTQQVLPQAVYIPLQSSLTPLLRTTSQKHTVIGTQTAINGVCGTANGSNSSSAPTTNLCTVGTASSVTGTGPWSWSCTGSNGGTTASCSANLIVNGAAGLARGKNYASLTVATSGLCSAGTVSNFAVASFFGTSTGWTWSCNGTNGGTTDTSGVAYQLVNGNCGSANGQTLYYAPKSGLCTSGLARAFGGNGAWTWACEGLNGGSTAACSANKLQTNGACGAANATFTNVAPTSNLCSVGGASAVSGSGPWTWTCIAPGGTTTSCEAFVGGIIPAYNDASTNWKNAGLLSVGGIPNRTTVCATVNPLGGGSDDFTNIQNAINNCAAGEVVQLGAGAFTVKVADLPLHIATGITVRGTGSCGGNISAYPSALCQTSINVADGILAYTGGDCGTSSANKAACPNGGPSVFLMAPVVPNYNYSWAKCGNTGAALGTGCGATPLTADAVQGQTTISVGSTTGLTVGEWILIDEASGAGWVADPLNATTGFGSLWAASDWLNPSGSPATGRVMWSKSLNGGGWDFSTSYPYQASSVGCWHSYCDRPTSELHRIASIGTGTVTFDDPLTIGFRQSGNHNAQIYGGLYDNQSGAGSPISFLQQAGIENLSILRGPNGGVTMQFCAYCWMKNTEVGDWYNGGVSLEYSARSELNGVYVHHCWDSVNSGGEYPIALDEASTEILITNSIANFGGKGMVARAGGAGSVVSYNYIDDTMYDDLSGIGDYWMDMGINASHYSGPHHVLFEGNWGDNMDNDNTHGNSMYMTFFRNESTGIRTPFTDPSNGGTVNDFTGAGYACPGGQSCFAQTPGPLRAVGPMAYNYWFAFVGNVLGLAGETTIAHGWGYEGDWSGKRIFMLGWNAGLPGATNQGGQDPYLNGVNGSYVYIDGNFDYVTNGVTWGGQGAHSFPNSLYLTQEPSFFTAGSGYTWPWVDPTGSPLLYTLPAKARYDAGTPFTQP